MNIPKPLPPERLYHRFDPDRFTFRTTAELEELQEVLGQERAMEAVEFGTGIHREGYNLYVMGPPGAGKRSLVYKYLERQAVHQPPPSDWCYLNHFDDPHRPKLVQLPAGRGHKLKEQLEHLIDELRTTLPLVFESDEYRARTQEIEDEIKERQEHAFSEIRKEASEHDINLIRTPGGFAFAPTVEGEVLSPQEYEKLPEDKQKEVERLVSELQEKLQRVIAQIPQWQREARERVKELNRTVADAAVAHMIDDTKTRFAGLPEVVEHLDALRRDVTEHVDRFRKDEGRRAEDSILVALEGGAMHEERDFFQRYRVNLLVDHGEHKGAPLVYEENPTLPNLVGRVEHQAHMGALVTDFTLIKAGALHKANGGYLILDALKLLIHPFAWEGLKRTLRGREVKIESLGQMYSMVSTVTLDPQPMPLDLKVIILGDRRLYYLLSLYDEEFPELFKVSADFEDEVERNEENALLYARMIGTLARKEKLRPFDSGAVARIVEHSSRMAEDAERLTTHMRSIADLQREADYWAGREGRNEVAAMDVQKAIDQRIRRLDRVRTRIHEEIRRGTILIDTEGGRVGQINGLSVLSLGEFSFGQPSRITATARLGEGEVLDIEREVELGGPIHSKAVMIISSFLADRYSRDKPLSLSASLVFEQSYGMVEGDSASVAELCVLLSAIGGIPIDQSLAVTGSINQHGEVQPIGGVNDKIEGFFDVCRARGLSGSQGVVIPASNVKHLMLRADVVEACAEGRFRIHAVERIDQAMELLMGEPAGEPDAEGNFPEGSINRRVQERLEQFAEIRQSFADKGSREVAGNEREGGAPDAAPGDGDTNE